MGGAGGKNYMGWWGHLGSPTQRGVVSYILSPYQQKAFAGVLHNAIFNTARRVSSQVPYVGTAFGIGYLIYTYANKKHAYLTSKAGHAEAGEH
ncbi:UcrQ family protein [Syncephalastrum racemosum]|uniref:Cytochrome b-c1 complex subunit 8 n=1 Tax=Syncephalastrum racemosum TaxID=13706 RepID=A0A1X2H3R2_SYNRA|nr:UcrQ family protein [Syncephalastrum racemosum]